MNAWRALAILVITALAAAAILTMLVYYAGSPTG